MWLSHFVLATSAGTVTEVAFTTASGAPQSLISSTMSHSNEPPVTAVTAENGSTKIDVSTSNDVTTNREVTSVSARSNAYQSATEKPIQFSTYQTATDDPIKSSTYKSVTVSSSEFAEDASSSITVNANLNVTTTRGSSTPKADPIVTPNEGN